MKKIYLLISILIISCVKDNYDFPEVNVYLNLNINNPKYFNIQIPGGWMYTNGGVGGILIYRQNIDEFIAYDRASTFDPTPECSVTVESDNIIIQDPCSESQYLITDGSVLQGPANQPLKRYNTIYNGNNLTVFN